jgi:hypothetical protein
LCNRALLFKEYGCYPENIHNNKLLALEVIEFMSLIKPEKRTVLLSINESLVKAMVRCIDEKLEGLTMLVGKFGRRRLMGLKIGSHIPMKVDASDWPRMKNDLKKLLDVGVFECDYKLENARYLVTRRLEEIVESKLRPYIEETESKRNLPHVTYPHPKGMGHYDHIKTGNFRKILTAFDAIHPRHMQRGIVAWPLKQLNILQRMFNFMSLPKN